MNKYNVMFLFFLFINVVNAGNCPQPHANSAMVLLVEDKESEMFDLKEKATQKGSDPGLLSKALKYLGYTTGKSQEEFALQVKSDAGLDKDPDLNNMTVDAFDYSLYAGQPQNHNLIILRAKEPSASDNFFYFYRKNAKGYAPVTRTPIDIYSKYCDSFPEYVSFNERDYIILEGSGGGTGVLESSAELYEVGKGSVQKVLSFPSSGDFYPSGSETFDEDFLAGPISFLAGGFTKTLQIPFTITFSAPERDGSPRPISQLELFKKNYLLKYDWSFLKQAFVFNPSSSDIPFTIEKEEDLYSLDPLSFFKRFNLELKSIAKQGDLGRKDWLRGFLKSDELKPLNDTEEMKQMKELLNSK